MTMINPGEHARTGSPWYRRLWDSDGFRRVARTFLFAFLGLLVPGVLGWLNGLTEWAQAEGQAPFPDARSLAYLGVAAISAGFIALLNALWVMVEDTSGKGLLREVPAKRTGEHGAGSTDGIALAALVIAILALLVLLL